MGTTVKTVSKEDMGEQAQTQEKALYNEPEGGGLHEGVFGELAVIEVRQCRLHIGKFTRRLRLPSRVAQRTSHPLRR